MQVLPPRSDRSGPPAAELSGSSALVALSTSVPSLLPGTLSAQSGSAVQLLPLAEGLWRGVITAGHSSYLPGHLHTLRCQMGIPEIQKKRGGVGIEEEKLAAKSPPGFSLTVSGVWVPRFQSWVSWGSVWPAYQAQKPPDSATKPQEKQSII